MARTLKVGIIGDYRPASRFHNATDMALQHAADQLAIPVDVTWVLRPSLEISAAGSLVRLTTTSADRCVSARGAACGHPGVEARLGRSMP